MKILTDKNIVRCLENDEFIAKDDINLADYMQEQPSIEEIYVKLGKYEAIEKELGIDLIALFSTKEVYCKADVRVHEKDSSGFPREKIEYGVVIKRELMSINLQKNTIQCGNRYSFAEYKIKDYGKTWAFTKEELEK